MSAWPPSTPPSRSMFWAVVSDTGNDACMANIEKAIHIYIYIIKLYQLVKFVLFIPVFLLVVAVAMARKKCNTAFARSEETAFASQRSVLLLETHVWCKSTPNCSRVANFHIVTIGWGVAMPWWSQRDCCFVGAHYHDGCTTDPGCEPTICIRVFPWCFLHAISTSSTAISAWLARVIERRRHGRKRCTRTSRTQFWISPKIYTSQTAPVRYFLTAVSTD